MDERKIQQQLMDYYYDKLTSITNLDVVAGLVEEMEDNVLYFSIGTNHNTFRLIYEPQLNIKKIPLYLDYCKVNLGWQSIILLDEVYEICDILNEIVEDDCKVYLEFTKSMEKNIEDIGEIITIDTVERYNAIKEYNKAYNYFSLQRNEVKKLDYVELPKEKAYKLDKYCQSHKLSYIHIDTMVEYDYKYTKYMQSRVDAMKFGRFYIFKGVRKSDYDIRMRKWKRVGL